jgi:phosphoglycerate dehydrogenase-like enzyme
MTQNSPPLPRTILLQAARKPLAQRILSRFPDLPLTACGDYQAVIKALETEQPEAMLALKVGKKEPFPREAILGCDSIKWIQASGAGVDHWTPWDTNRVTITNASGIHAEVMAQYTIWAILNHRLGFPRMAQKQAESIWDKKLLVSATGATLAVVGFGRIGQEVGRLGRALGMKVIGVRTRPAPSPHADDVVGMDRLDEVLGQADYVLNVLPLTADTKGLFGSKVFAAMKKGAYLINTGRGHIVDEVALIAALKSGHLSGATLDVFATEPLPADNSLWQMKNVIITPHTAGDAENWENEVAELFCDNLQRWIDGDPLQNIVDPVRGY